MYASLGPNEGLAQSICTLLRSCHQQQLQPVLLQHNSSTATKSLRNSVISLAPC